MERAILLNNHAVYSLSFGKVGDAHSDLREALAIAKAHAHGLHNQGTYERRGGAAAQEEEPLSETRVHSSVQLAGFADHPEGLFLYDQGMLISTESWQSLRPTWTGDWQPTESATPELIRRHVQLMEESPIFATTCGAIIVFNLALIFHHVGVVRNDGRSLRDAATLYKMVIGIVSECTNAAGAGAFGHTYSILRIAAANNLVPIQVHLGNSIEASHRMTEAESLVRSTRYRAYIEPYVLQGIIMNHMAMSSMKTNSAGAA
mmetsp:Transcript_12712/g.22862  ORF Transcript_12712/g.22862 Transcript_12712/m.22862 type:complete len:261 (-) Transcript_12712:86-868(-)|eukprot:CAMPEP_0178759622 /NCGR_PEP_ID=MMETSP0744-20121128/15039_1 /TAXON_ID=913974 /ORGANISM="Nitzschia punctata, Strain CCMP561" /LENGTH=260 /DNA_ID=CAMNT_0020414109 /DNA_START=14 /DNA_END=796 /DNA_ORIENTATION=+